ncbi:MAG: tetratricopeptide repeat protein [Holophagales bacterium]|nr:tetratricopeptide repeat protein [Holophagales bacterium]
MPDEDAEARGNPWPEACVLRCVRSLPMTIRRPSALLVLVPLLAALAAGPTSAAGAALPSAPIQAALEKGDPDAAAAAADAVLAAAPRDADALLWAGRAYGMKAMSASIFTKMSWARKCHEAWERAIELAPANAEARFELIRYYLMAPGIAGGGVEKAQAQAVKLGELDAMRGYLARGMIADHEKKPKEAEAAYRKAMEADQFGVQGPIALASFFARQKRWPEARAIFERRVAADPKDAFALYQLGRLSLLSGEEMEKGLTLFDRFLSLDAPKDGPTHADARWRKGLLLEKLGRTPAAIAEYREALKTQPGHAGAKRELERLKAA